MGYNQNGKDTYWPDDDDTSFYMSVDGTVRISDIVDKAREKWGEDIHLDDLIITSEYIHTDCIYYDLYDPSDWTNFILVTLAPT